MRIGLIVAFNEIVQLCRLRTVILMLFGLPLLLIFLLGNALDTGVKPVRLSLAVEDEGELGQAFKQYLAGDIVSGHLALSEKTGDAQVRSDVQEGKADYGVYVPADFTGEVHAGAGELHVYPGNLAERNLAAESVLNGFVQEIRVRQAAAFALGADGLAAAENSFAAPAAASAAPMVKVGTLLSQGNVEYGAVSALQYYAVAYLIMFLLFSGMSAAISLTEEREKGTLLRLYAVPAPMSAILFGKLGGVALFSFVQALFIVTFTATVYGVEWGGDYAGIALICALTSLSAIAFAVVIASFIRSRKGIESVFSLLVVMMTFLSGGMIPNLGPMLQDAGTFTINYWAMSVLRSLMSGGDLAGSWKAVAVLGAITAALLWLSAIRYRKAVAVS